MLKKYFILFLVAVPLAGAAPRPSESIQWLTFEQAVAKAKTDKKKIFIDVYTDWCGWCKVMDKNTFTDPAVIKLMNEKFHAVKFNAEQRQDVVFGGKTFKFVETGRGGYHELAAALLNNQLSYPNFVFLDEEVNYVTALPGYHKPDFFHMVLKFIADNEYKSRKFDDYQKVYQSPYPKPAGK